MDLKLKNKWVLITGSSRGIGYSIAENFLIEGASVILVARNKEKLKLAELKLQDKYGKDKVRSKVCNCLIKDALDKLSNSINKELGTVDIVVANIGNGESVADPIPEYSQWQRTWNINFESALLTARAFLPMLEESRGNILFVSSIAGIEAFGAPTDYSTAKTAVIALAKNMARKLAPNVRVNVIAPGNVYFKGGSWDKKIEQNKDLVSRAIEEAVPMNRFATPSEIANSVVFLCSDKAKFITGATLVVDGGQTVGVI